MRLTALLLMSSLSLAPFQCSSEPDPEKRREDTPAEALYALSGDFQKAGDKDGQVRTLKYLVSHYPRSRYAVTAHQELVAMGIEVPDPNDLRDASGPVVPPTVSAAPTATAIVTDSKSPAAPNSATP